MIITLVQKSNNFRTQFQAIEEEGQEGPRRCGRACSRRSQSNSAGGQCASHPGGRCLHGATQRGGGRQARHEPSHAWWLHARTEYQQETSPDRDPHHAAPAAGQAVVDGHGRPSQKAVPKSAAATSTTAAAAAYVQQHDASATACPAADDGTVADAVAATSAAANATSESVQTTSKSTSVYDRPLCCR